MPIPLRIYLIGFMGSGKSTLGRSLAQQLNYTFFDTDEWIENNTGMTIPVLFKTKGEEWFREQEKNVLSYLTTAQHIVISTGGGMPCYGNNIEVMKKSGTTVWLHPPENILVQRLLKDASHRPLLQQETDITAYVHHTLQRRMPFYSQAHFTYEGSSAQEMISLFTS